jgi:two-component system cell cycle response regulator DivK
MADTPMILHVEDNFENRVLIRRLLQSVNYQVIEAENAAEALTLVETIAPPNLILMDINMPDMDGYSLTSLIKEKTGYDAVPIVAITANVMRGDREKVLQAGCDGYIEKPINVDTFLDQLAQYLKQ